jgi:L-iditol 2-dehydrogenase
MESVVLFDGEVKNVGLVNKEIPQIEEHQLLVRVKRAGICGTDLKLYTGSYPVNKNSLPVVLGHEFIGEVVAVGAKVTKAVIGDRIVAQPTYSSCGECRYCIRGEFNLCNKRTRIGFDYDGVFAEYVKLNEYQIHILPDSISDDAGALIEPLTVAIRGVYKADIKPTDTVLITGPGTIGLLTALVAKQLGATVIVSGTKADAERLEIATSLGADLIDMSGNLPTILEKKGIEIDVVLECSGNAKAVEIGLNLLRPKGQFVQIGTASYKIDIPFMDIAYKELIVTGSISAIKEDWKAAIKLMEKVQSKALLIVTKHLSLKEFEKGFEECLQNGGPKVLFTP